MTSRVFPSAHNGSTCASPCTARRRTRCRCNTTRTISTSAERRSALDLDGWSLRFVNLGVEPVPGWYGASHATATASLEVVRQSGPLIAAIFVPLLATLVIPLLAIWLNRVEDGAFKVETYEMVNIIIGGLFAVIALNFTVSSVFEVLNAGDNPVNRLFALNYLTLAISLAVNILLVRFRFVERLFGVYVQEQLYLFLVWAIPLLVLTTAASVILVALA